LGNHLDVGKSITAQKITRQTITINMVCEEKYTREKLGTSMILGKALPLEEEKQNKKLNYNNHLSLHAKLKGKFVDVTLGRALWLERKYLINQISIEKIYKEKLGKAP